MGSLVLYSLNWGSDWLGRRPMTPDLLRDPGPSEEDSGLLRGGSKTRMGNEEMRRGGDSVTDLDREREKNYILFFFNCY